MWWAPLTYLLVYIITGIYMRKVCNTKWIQSIINKNFFRRSIRRCDDCIFLDNGVAKLFFTQKRVQVWALPILYSAQYIDTVPPLVLGIEQKISFYLGINFY